MENILSPWRALNKAFLRLNPSWQEITPWRDNLLNLLQNIHDGETEEFHKNLIRDFLQKTYYQNDHFINTKGWCDLVVHVGKDTNSPVGLILECKSPTNKAEMPKPDQLNVKGLQQLLFYFLAERINQKNFELKHLIVTNCYEWFVFDAQEFERLFIQNQSLVKQFKDFGEDRLSGSRTKFFYENIAGPAIENIQSELKFTYWDLRNYQTVIEKATPDQELTAKEQRDLVALFKIFSPEHLLKLPFANDSNTLNREFYNELLHIIGLTETKHGNKKLIERLPANERNPGSLLEGAIREIENLDKLPRLSNPERYGNTAEEQLFNVALELVITWVNRILFLKLLEAQLIRYHQGDHTFAFLNIRKLRIFWALNQLFFSILAKEQTDRPTHMQEEFSNVPYLNSSLFEPTDLELDMIVIGNLNGMSSIFHQTILKDSQGNRLTGKLDAIQYFFEFLDAYDFGSDGAGGIQEKSKSLINAAVLGLIFEKINGYQDGSFYTPGFITMYMCRETIRRAVVQKFNEVKGWNCHNFADLQEELVKYIRQSSDRIIPRNEANQIINSLKICDPAVGSGHFLVSALNEIIVVKHQLGILQDKNGNSLGRYEINVENDELIITDTNNDNVLFEYNPKNKESQRVQETIFHEKQTLIENCLFGVDININSVKICQLRLWIELLKNAYYKKDQQLETLPNIDINIKHGNSLISRFGIDADLKSILIARKNKSDIADYRNATHAYFQATSKEEKNQAKKTISEIKQKIKNSLQSVSHERSKLKKLEQELFNLENQPSLLEESKTEKKAKEKKIAQLNNEIDKLKVVIEEEESGQLYNNTLEWRFEFPEILNDQGDFIGFDIVIGNPPYGRILNNLQKDYIIDQYFYNDYQLDIYNCFFELAERIIKSHSLLCFVTPNTWLLNLKTPNIRQLLFSKFIIYKLRLYQEKVFQEAVVDISIFIGNKNILDKNIFNVEIINKNHEIIINHFDQRIILDNYQQPLNVYESDFAKFIKNKFSSLEKLNDIANITQGTKPFQKGKGNPPQSQRIVDKKPFVANYKKDKTFIPLLRGSLINKYSISWNNDYYISFGEWLAEPRYSANYDAPEKILVRQTGSSLIATLDVNQFIARDNLYVITSKNINYPEKIILGLLNSNLLNWYYQNTINNEKGEALAQVKRGHLAVLPMPSFNAQLFKKVIQLVNKIMKSKKSNPNANTTKLEKEIDRFVYELYSLTEEEIAIVENHND